MRFLKAVLCLFVALLTPMRAQAHPHILALYDVIIEPAEKGFIKLNFTFHFSYVTNPLYTPGAMMTDAPPMQNTMAANIAQHPFFIYLDVNGTPIVEQPVVLSPALGNSDNNPVYVSTVTLPETVEFFNFSINDPTLFIAVWQSQPQAVNVGVDHMVCAYEERLKANTLWGPVNTQYVRCGNDQSARSPFNTVNRLPPKGVPIGRRIYSNNVDLLP